MLKEVAKITSFVLIMLLLGFAYLQRSDSYALAELPVDKQLTLRGGCYERCNENIKGCWTVPWCGTDDDKCAAGAFVCVDHTKKEMCADFVGPDQDCVYDDPASCNNYKAMLGGLCNRNSGYCYRGGDYGTCGTSVSQCHEE